MSNNTLATNRKAFHNYHIVERFEAGIQLIATEVKSCINGEIGLNDAFAKVEQGELFLINSHIATCSTIKHFNHDPNRIRKLLMRRRQLHFLDRHVAQNGFTLVPLSFYLSKSLIKVELALVKGKNSIDKRENLKRKDGDRIINRAMKYFNG